MTVFFLAQAFSQQRTRLRLIVVNPDKKYKQEVADIRLHETALSHSIQYFRKKIEGPAG